eukprot:357022-Chlamydomonas_euryale.AAC.2
MEEQSSMLCFEHSTETRNITYAPRMRMHDHFIIPDVHASSLPSTGTHMHGSSHAEGHRTGRVAVQLVWPFK